MKLTPDIDRRERLDSDTFERSYLRPLVPVVLTDAIDHWAALGKWTPEFFKTRYGHLQVEVDGESMPLRELVERVEASTPERPAPYLRNQALAEWPPELLADVSPMPDCTRPNWLQSRLFPSRGDLSATEVYIGGRGASFPVLHYDNLHTHAFLMQLYGEKEYLAFRPDQAGYLYPRDGMERNKSRIADITHPDGDAFPLADRAEGLRFRLGPGETLFVPAGWWHTARIISPSITVSINAVNRANGRAFRHDYLESLHGHSPLVRMGVGAVLSFGSVAKRFEMV
jgi:hypothetical protein